MLLCFDEFKFLLHVVCLPFDIPPVIGQAPDISIYKPEGYSKTLLGMLYGAAKKVTIRNAWEKIWKWLALCSQPGRQPRINKMSKKTSANPNFKPRIYITDEGVSSVSASEVLKTTTAQDQLKVFRRLVEAGLLKNGDSRRTK